MTEVGTKNDQDKLPWHLMPWDALEEVVWILEFGARKYGERNWEKGMDWHRLARAGIGHFIDWFRRKDGGFDPETGRSHLAHAICCGLFLLAFELRTVGKDTRP